MSARSVLAAVLALAPLAAAVPALSGVPALVLGLAVGVLVATHDLELAAELGDRALALVDGVVVAGAVGELAARVPALERDPA